MRFIGNVLWFVLCGLILALLWAIVGLLWCVTIVGIPVGVQCFKCARLSLWPFGRQIEYGGGGGSLLLNILWIGLGGAEIALTAAVIGVVLYVTIIGIPFGKQCLKIAKLALMPFGAKIV